MAPKLPYVGGGDESTDMNDMDADDVPASTGSADGHAATVPDAGTDEWPGLCGECE